MLLIAVALNVVGALGMVALGAKYFFGPAPADYHLQIMGMERRQITVEQGTVFSVLYRALGAAAFAVAVAIMFLAVFGVAEDLTWAKLAVLATGLTVGAPTTFFTHIVEQKSGVTTPWKPAAALTAILILAFVLSML